MFGNARERMQGVRPAAVAGLFYPDDCAALRRTVDRLLLDAAARADVAPPKAVIAPHAGYPYSGPIAGNAFEPLRSLRGTIDRVVIFGPSHRVAFAGLALPAAEAFETPLGRIEIDLDGARGLLELDAVRVDPAPHREEHGIEVELPFLQQVLGEFRLVPVVVGHAEPAAVARALEIVWGDERTLVVISSDLSHFHSYDVARRIDRETAAAIVALRSPLAPAQACGAQPINGLLRRARELALAPLLLDLRSSGDTAGGHDRVVGYGAFAFHPREDDP